MRKVLVGVVVCSAVAAGFFWMRGDESPSTPSGSVGAGRSPLSAKDALLTGELKAGTGKESLRGHVYDAAGPVAGATLVAVRVDEEEDLSALECGGACLEKTVECDSWEATQRVSEWVKARRGEAPPVARTTSGADGAFEFTGLEPGLHRVWSFADERGVAVSKKVTPGPSELEVAFERPAPISGKVVDGKGKPVAGLWVTAFLPDMPRYFDAQTGPDGTFTFGSLPSSHLSLLALGPDGALAHLHLSDASQGRSPRNKLRLLLAAPFEHAVQVRVEGKPAAGATVSRFDGVHRREWTTDAAGEVKVTLNPGARGWLAASLGTLGGRVEFARSNTPRVKPIVIELVAMEWVSGEVRNEEGRPLAAASVSSGGLVVLTDDAGRYRMGPFASQGSSGMHITASATGHVSSTAQAAVSPGAKTDFTLVRGAKLSGRVLSPEGLPLEGADVSATQPEGEFPRFSEHRTSGPGGTFMLDDLKPGPCTVIATHPLWGTVQRESSAPDPALELRMEGGAELEITFVDEASRPLQLSVMLMSDEPMVRGKGVESSEPRSGQTDRHGRVQFKGLRAGKFVLVPSDQGEKRSISTVELTDREHRELRVVLEEGLRIEGQVLDTDGKPMPEVSVDASPEKTGPALGGLRPSAMLAEMGGRARSETDAQGRFQLRHLSPGNHRVAARGMSGMAETTAVAGATGIELRVPVQLLASGRVVDEQRAPVTQFRAGDEEIDSASGEFRVEVRNGMRVLYLAAEGYPTRQVELTGEPIAHVIDVGTIVLLAPREVKVTVLDAQTSRPVAGATVMSAGRFAERAAPLLTDAEGVANVGGVGGDESGVFVQAEGYLQHQVVVPPGMKEQVVALARGARLAGQVFALDGGPGHADIRLGSPDGGVAFGRADEKGQYEVTAAPGAWEVRADFGFNHLKQPPGQVTLVAGQTTRMDFREPGGGVTVAVAFVDARGEPVMMMGVLVPGVVPTPDTFEAWRELMKRGQRILPMGRESAASPGEATLVAMAMAMNSEQMFVFTERLMVTAAPRQSFTVRVPTNLTELKRPKR